MTTLNASRSFTLKKYRSAEGMEGMAWSATLCCDGKPFAEVRDDGNGGCLWWHFTEDGANPHTGKGAPLGEKWLAAVAARGSDYAEEDAIFVEEILNRMLTAKTVRRLGKSKTRVYFVEPGDDLANGYRYLKVPKGRTVDEGLAHLRKTRPDAIPLADERHHDAIVDATEEAFRAADEKWAAGDATEKDLWR